MPVEMEQECISSQKVDLYPCTAGGYIPQLMCGSFTSLQRRWMRCLEVLEWNRNSSTWIGDYKSTVADRYTRAPADIIVVCVCVCP